MKRKLKSAVALLLLVAVCFSLCSCKALDNMRKEQAFYTEEGNIIWNGTTYKQLPETMPNIYKEDIERGGHVTESDVPVLLSSSIGDYFTLIEPYGFLSISGYSYYDSLLRYYCPEETYDYYVELAKNCVLNKYCYEVYTLSDDGKDYIEKLVMAWDDFEAAIADTLENHRQDDMKYRYKILYQLCLCDETKTFYNPSINVVEVENIGYYMVMETYGVDAAYYKVPNEYEHLFEAAYDEIKDSKEKAYRNAWTGW